jgi:hypothetical protein
MRGEVEFDRAEIEKIVSILHLSDDEMRTIFFEDIVA